MPEMLPLFESEQGLLHARLSNVSTPIFSSTPCLYHHHSAIDIPSVPNLLLIYTLFSHLTNSNLPATCAATKVDMVPKAAKSQDRNEGDDMSVDTSEIQRVEEETVAQGNDSTPSETQSSRRVTRSQTGRVAKRRLPDDGLPEPKKRPVAPPKKQKTVSRQSSTVQDQEPQVQHSPPVVPPTHVAVSDATPESDLGPSTSRITFLEVSTVGGDQGERRMSRTRAFFPVPVPNLTKKSRGRRVPTTQTVNTAAPQPDKRLYICKVEGCGKCFHRGEHLKRHIRSIHTHEKPFKCTFPLCEKYFNRHDNLLQHLKVHKESKAERAEQSMNVGSERTTPPLQTQRHDSPTSEAPDSPTIPRPRTIYDHQPSLYTGYANSAPFESPAEPMRFVTNMAVSSLRTEIPQSPTEMRPASYPWHHRSEYSSSKDQLSY